jgi:hypothetical protein
MAPFFKGFKQRNLVCRIFEGTQKTDEKSDSMLEMDNRFRSGGIGKSG